MRVLESQLHKNTMDSGGFPKTHILNEELSYHPERHPFYVTGICGIAFRAYNKDDAPKLNKDNLAQVNCVRCSKKGREIKL